MSQNIKDNKGHIRPASQVQVTFSITLPPNTPSNEEVYLAADFGSWRTDSPAYKFERSGNQARLSLWLPHNLNFRYKYTRGSWYTVEVAANGGQLPNRWGIAVHNRVFHDNIATWQDRLVKIPRIDPRVERITLNSKILKVPKSFYIFLPPDYDEPYQRNERYPVLYLFRGHEREWVNAEEDPSREGRTVIDTYLEALEKGLVGRMILVFPGISSDEDSVPGLLVNFKDPKLAGGAHGIGTGLFEDYFLQELMPYLDNRYRTLTDGTHRGVAGFSLGGLTAIKIAAQYPQLFNSASAYDGTFFYSTRSGKSIRQDDRVFSAPLFNPHFGVPRDYLYGAANNPTNLIIQGHKATLGRICWMIQSGPESAEPGDANYYRAQHLIKSLAGHNIKNALPPVLEDGRHNWHTADRHLSYALPLHWQQLKPGEN